MKMAGLASQCCFKYAESLKVNDTNEELK
jgi:hypothetical protein